MYFTVCSYAHITPSPAQRSQALGFSEPSRDLGCNRRSCINKVSWFTTRYPFSSLCRKRMKSKASVKLWQGRFFWSEPSTEDKSCHSDHSSISFHFNTVPLCLPWLCLGKLFHISPFFSGSTVEELMFLVSSLCCLRLSPHPRGEHNWQLM